VTYRLAAVYAHPDDDTNGIAGLLAAERDGLEYTLVVATSGEAGEIADPKLATPETLGPVREREELASLEVVGVRDPVVHFLRYPDGALASVPREELVDRVAGILRKARPQVVITFGPDGITRHSDHIAAGQAATDAFNRLRLEAPGDGAFRRLLYNALPKSMLDAFWAALRERGREVDPDAPFMPQGIPDDRIAVRVGLDAVMDRKMKAIAAHRTQAFGFIPADLRRRAFAAEHFVQAWPPVAEEGGHVLASVFEGLER
jgi:LmbE family N-acetylglucosaminyl deacetylase